METADSYWSDARSHKMCSGIPCPQGYMEVRLKSHDFNCYLISPCSARQTRGQGNRKRLVSREEVRRCDAGSPFSSDI